MEGVIQPWAETRRDNVDLRTVAHERLDVFPVSQFRKPGVRLVALHVDQPSFRHSHISVRMVELVEFPDLVEEDAVRVRLLDLPPVCESRAFNAGSLCVWCSLHASESISAEIARRE